MHRPTSQMLSAHILAAIRDPAERARIASKQTGATMQAQPQKRNLAANACDDGPIASGYEQQTERVLQKLCENWLMGRGYLPITADNAGMACNGWFAHWPERRKPSRKVPLMPDLMIWSPDMSRCCRIELKVGASPAYQPGQRESIDAGRWTECRTLDAVIAAVCQWEAGL